MDRNNRFSAAGPHYGHLIQETLMFKYLFDANDEDAVSLEYYDDVAVEKEDGEIWAIQSKSALSWNPVSNRSPDFWKTFSNWITMSQEGNLSPKRTKFILAIAQKRSGKISDLFQQAKNDADFDMALRSVEEEFKDEIPEAINTYIHNFFNADKELLKSIILNFDIAISESPRGAVIERLEKQEEKQQVDIIFTMMTGWIKDNIELAIERGNVPVITGKQFRNQIFAARREIAQQAFLHSYAQEPSQEERDEHLMKTYVKQLELVKCNTEEKLEAITSYINAKVDRIKWADDGCVHKHSFDDFYSSVEKKWKNEKRRVSIDHPKDSPDINGRRILYNCNDFKERLAGMDVPSYFTSGCFHDCSNQLKIGWHEDYLNLLGGNNDK
ncbi:ABC-three component system protein [Desulfovibrio sp.]|uniref:ABC-three component system protein n=1 Tax=Desulfovibrio sp. TaxID=885 RepID=UPI003D0A1C5E